MKTYSKYLFQLIQLATLVVLICSSAKPGIAEVYNEEFLFKKLDQLFAANRDNFKDKELKKIIQDKNVKGMFQTRNFIAAKSGEIWRIKGDTYCIQVFENALFLSQAGVIAKYIHPGATKENMAQKKVFEKKDFPLDDICYVGPSAEYTTVKGEENFYVPLYSFGHHPQFIPRVIELCEIEIERRKADKTARNKAGKAQRLVRAKKELTRTFKSKNGEKKVTATILSLDDDKISLWITEKRKSVQVNIDMFSVEDAKWIEEKKVWIKKFGSKLEEEFSQGN